MSEPIPPIQGVPPPTGDLDPHVGRVLAGRYTIDRVIAWGGMGRVYLATQMQLSRRVALKVLPPSSLDLTFRDRFLLEAATAAKLAHQHIVTVHDYGETEDGELFMAMEFLDGTPLSKLLEQGPLDPSRVMNIALQLCRGLRAAHAKGVIHRDVKPSNIMLLRIDDEEADFVKILDFGLAKIVGVDAGPRTRPEITGADVLVGSPRYMAPELIRKDPVDARTDIYSLGATMYHMLTGRPPFQGDALTVMHSHLNEAPPPIAVVMGERPYPLELGVVIARCLEKDPEARYASIQDLMDDLKASERLSSESALSDSFHDLGPSDPFAHSNPGIRAVAPRGPSLSNRPERAASKSGLPALVTPPVSREAMALSEMAPDLTASLSEAKITPPPAAPSKAPMAVGLVGIAVGLLAVAVLWGRRAEPPPPAKAPPAPAVASTPPPAKPAPVEPPTESRITFESDPPGAQVLQGSTVLGTTPFTKAFPFGDAALTFRFRLRGHSDVSVVAPTDRAERTLRAKLPPGPPEPEAPARPAKRPRPEPKPEPERPADSPPGFRDNPY